MPGRALALLARWQRSHPGRAWARYGAQRGPLLAGGLAYVAVFSVFSILFAAFTVLGLVLRDHPAALHRVLTTINDEVPHLVDTSADESGSAPVKPRQLLAGSLLSWTGAVAFVLALLSGLGWVDALREGVRAMFGVPTDSLGPVAQRLRDALGLVTFGVAVLASALLSVVVGAGGRMLLDAVGAGGGLAATLVLRAGSIAIVFVVDTGIFLVLLRVLARLPIGWRDLRSAALVGAAAMGVLKQFAGVLLAHSATSNPLVASAGVLAGILVWMNLVSRVVLVTAAWAAVDPGVVARLRAEDAPVAGPSAGPGLAPVAPTATTGGRRGVVPTPSQRSADRVSVAAGMVWGALLGGAATWGLRPLVRAGRRVRGARRR